MKKQVIIYISVIAMLASSCLNYQKVTYTVKAGEHRSSNKVTLLKKDKVSFRFTTDSTWYWPVPDKNGFTKITGIGWNSNHENSARLCYLRLNDSIGVFADYYYLNGISPQQNPQLKTIIDTIVIGKKYQGSVGYDNRYYFIRLNNKHHSVKIGEPPFPKTAIRNLQHPYIGGVYTIDHDFITTLENWQ